MDVFEAIHDRHSIKKVKHDAVPREMIERLLDAAVQAPNHYKVRPWRFVVLTGEALNRLGDVMSASLRGRHPEFPEEAFDKARLTPLQLRIYCSPRMHWGLAQNGALVNGRPMLW